MFGRFALFYNPDFTFLQSIFLYLDLASEQQMTTIDSETALPLVKLKRFSTKRINNKQNINNADSSSSSSDAQAVNKTKKKRSAQNRHRYHSVKCPSGRHEVNTRLSLRVKNSVDTVTEFRPKSHSLLVSGGQLYSRERDLAGGIGSSDSLVQPHTAATTLTNVSLSSLIMPLQQSSKLGMPKHNVQVRNLKAKWNNVNRDVIYILYEIYNKAKRLRHNLSTHALKTYDVLTDQIVQNFAASSGAGGVTLNGQGVEGLASLNRNVSSMSEIEYHIFTVIYLR